MEAEYVNENIFFQKLWSFSKPYNFGLQLMYVITNKH